MLRVYIIVDLTTDDDNSSELYMCGAGSSCSTATVAIPLTRLWQKQKNTLKTFCLLFLFSTLKGKGIIAKECGSFEEKHRKKLIFGTLALASYFLDFLKVDRLQSLYHSAAFNAKQKAIFWSTFYIFFCRTPVLLWETTCCCYDTYNPNISF